jgi:hypothetical protein
MTFLPSLSFNLDEIQPSDDSTSSKRLALRAAAPPQGTLVFNRGHFDGGARAGPIRPQTLSAVSRRPESGIRAHESVTP